MADPGMGGRERETLLKVADVLRPLDSKIDHSLYIGTEQQMRADLNYLRGLLAETRTAILQVLYA